MTSNNLLYLIQNVDKNDHLLAPSDLNCNDKMKFRPREIEKFINPLINLSLKSHVDDSDGTGWNCSIYINDE